MLDRIVHHLPWLGPLIAAGVGAGVGRYGLNGGFWTVLVAALVGGFLPLVVREGLAAVQATGLTRFF